MLDDAVQERLPPAAFVTEMLCAAGTAPPTVYLKLIAWEETANTFGLGATVRLTLREEVVFEAPAAVTCTVPE